MRKSVFFALGIGCALTMGCDDSPNPAFPTSLSSAEATAAGITSVPQPTATVIGTVQNITTQPALVRTGSLDAAPFRVIVVGTSLSTEVDTRGQFTLEGVPSSFVELSFQGPGVDAPLRLGRLQPGQRMHIIVTVNGSIVRVVTPSHERSNDHERNRYVQIEGAVARLKGTCPLRAFVVRTTIVKTNTVSNIDKGCRDLRNGVVVEVTGKRQRDGSILAARIEREDEDEDDDDDDKDDDDDDDRPHRTR